MLAIKAKGMNEDGTMVNYDVVRESDEFKEYLSSVQQLNFIDLSGLD
jgi:hypothetical protein